ncbi:membrane bound O-acyl transferase MBOAT family protein [Desulfofarcimen acetoxidans DSM 771]|uniref:Membrane bound O-acyl transferase MBOAT family protein n=1 Tax=Desulfofarcimen acetoxidans (strain ATCC 49208 / DSM 771 / KCTC 5769 / VKM B-1644 / 5575) TaxID=485916 RepID=C8W2E8_DESAS|nr:MBOAT family protein [Desulfofarcimen acetoxidans]ACV63632.1 membrane bound O-acyl transferase MBOAT family protein [Desulfofarcimen acetoxidans DSM 771]
MVFSSIQFLIFFAFLILLFILLKGKRIKKNILLIASIFFYAYWDIRFVPLLLGIGVFNYIVGHIVADNSDKKKNRKIALVIGVTVNLLVLAYFKYTNFFIENANEIFSSLGFNTSTLNIILPLGISFFIFELISYLADVYTNKIKHTDSFVDFLTFVFFFPRLASGPIIRPADFLPQLKQEIVIKKHNIVVGIQLFTMGLFKKLVLADRVAVCADAVFHSPQLFDSPTIWCGVIAYSIQIYCDFSGYSDMALGVAKIMGFDLPRNFNMPYISLNITEFWRRWHISLSAWLRDYLYITLGGNRKGRIRQNVNIIITMLLGGFWHGASWTFLVWGGLHGAALIVQKAFSKWNILNKLHINHYISNSFSWLLTYIFVCVCWVFFRASTFTDAFIIINKMFVPSDGINWIFSPLFYFVLPVVIAATIIKCMSKREGYLTFNLSQPLPAFGFVFTVMAIIFFDANNTSPFIYFQF